MRKESYFYSAYLREGRSLWANLRLDPGQKKYRCGTVKYEEIGKLDFCGSNCHVLGDIDRT